MGCVMQAGEQSQQRRPQRGAGLEAARKRAGTYRRPPVRLVAAGAALRRAGGDVRHDGLRHRRRRREHDARADGRCRAICRPRTGFGTLHEPGACESAIPSIQFSQFIGAEMMAEKYGSHQGRARRVSRCRATSARIAATAGRRLQGRDRAAEVTRADGGESMRTRRRRHPLRRHPRRHRAASSCCRKAAASPPPAPARSATAPRA